jgi:ABC-type transporter Mla subunit MlaD
MDESRYQTRVGAALMLVLLVAIVFTVTILPRIEWGKHVRLMVTFHELGGLRSGASVVVAGRVVGTIERVDRSDDVSAGDRTKVIVHIALRASYAARVHHDSDFFVSSHGPLSERYLEIANRIEQSDELPGLQQGEVVVGVDPPSIDRVLQNTWNNLLVARRFLEAVGPSARELMVQVRSLNVQLNATSPVFRGYWDIAGQAVALVDQVDMLQKNVGGSQSIATVRRLTQQASDVLKQLQIELDGVAAEFAKLQGPELARLSDGGSRAIARAKVAVSSLQSLVAHVDPVLANVDALVAILARGEGSLLRIMTDPEFPEDTKELGKILKRTPWRTISHPFDIK